MASSQAAREQSFQGNKKSVSEETFGVDVVSPRISGGRFVAFGHQIREGEPIPDRGTSVNVKTGYPVKGQGK
jgi:hypothetical protein